MKASVPRNYTGSILFETPWGYAVALVLIAALTLATFKVWVPYSYWMDELVSVHQSTLTLPALHGELLNDVHPPLYQMILKVWAAVFGFSEPATRSLSWLCALGGMVLLYRFSSRLGHLFLITALIFLLTCRLFIYYANETRSYAMVLFFSMAVFTTYPFLEKEKISGKFLVSCLLLSLTHYFGLALVGIVLGALGLERLRRPGDLARIASTGTVCLLWPIHHFLHGTPRSKTGGKFWIAVDGIGDSFAIAASGFLPNKTVYGGYGLVIGLVAAILLSIRSKTWDTTRHALLATINLKTSSIALLFLMAIALLDLHTPLSFERYYIVILPALSISFAAMTCLLAVRFPRARGAMLTLFLLLSGVLLQSSYAALKDKALPFQDWRNSVAIALSHAEGRQIYVRSDGNVMIIDHYLQVHGVSGRKIIDYKVGQTALTEPAVIIYGHITNDEKFRQFMAEMARLGGQRIFPAKPPMDGIPIGVFLLDARPENSTTGQ